MKKAPPTTKTVVRIAKYLSLLYCLWRSFTKSLLLSTSIQLTISYTNKRLAIERLQKRRTIGTGTTRGEERTSQHQNFSKHQQSMAVTESTVSAKAVVPTTQPSSKANTSTNDAATYYGGGPVFVFGIDIDDELWAATPSPNNCPFRPKNQVKPLNVIFANDETCSKDTASVITSVSSITVPSGTSSSTGPLVRPSSTQTCNDKQETKPASDDGKYNAAEPLPFKLQHDPLGLLLFGLSG
jgi:hypothetical protein